MEWITTKADMLEAIDDLSKMAGVAIRDAIFEATLEYPVSSNRLFEHIGKLKSMVEHLPEERSENEN